MTEAFHCRAEDRALIAVSGPDARSFLQGIVTNDVNKVSAARAIHAALLTPQGKYLHDFFIAEREGALLLDCEAARRDDLVRRLGRFKLRSNVAVVPAADLAVHLVYGAYAAAALGLPPDRGAARVLDGGIAYVDPRLAAAGVRAVLPVAATVPPDLRPGAAEDYDRLRLSLGLPDGSRDLEVEKSILLENGFNELAGVDWNKGCYMGQELTARTHYRALIRKRLVPVALEGPVPPAGTPVTGPAGEVGIMRSAREGIGLALLRVEAIAGGAALAAGSATVRPIVPDWLKIEAGA